MGQRGGSGIVSQFKIEGTPGEGGAANRYVESLNFNITRKNDPKKFRGSGSRINTVVVQHKRMATGTLNSVLDYNSFPYICLGLFQAGARTQIDTSGAYQQIFTAGARTSDMSRKTFACEYGDDVACEDYNLVQLLGFTLNSTQEEFNISAPLICNYPQDNQVLSTSGIVTVPPSPVQRSDVGIFIDESFEDLGNTILAEATSEEIGISNKFKEVFFHNRVFDSFADIFEIPYEPQLNFSLGHGAQSRSLITQIKEDKDWWVRWEALGRVIGQNASSQDVREMIRLDMMIRFDGAESIVVDDQPFGYKYMSSMMNDADGLQTHLKITTINERATL